MQGKVEELSLEVQVDVLVSEPMGTLLVNERMLETYLYARDRFLKKGGRMFPVSKGSGTLSLSIRTVTCKAANLPILQHCSSTEGPFGKCASSMGLKLLAPCSPCIVSTAASQTQASCISELMLLLLDLLCTALHSCPQLCTAQLSSALHLCCSALANSKHSTEMASLAKLHCLLWADRSPILHGLCDLSVLST